MNELLRRLLFLPPQASALAAEIDHLHYFVILVTFAGAVLITLVGGVFLIRYRRTATPPEPAPNRPAPRPPAWLEWGVVSGLLGLFLLWWVIGFRQYVRIRVAPANTLDMYVTAKQWMWKFAYPGGEKSIATLYVPAGKAVKVILTSRDVIHSFYVPDLRIKQDVLPGRYTTAWFIVDQPGVHQILCAEFCGTGHSTMRGEVIALAPEDYDRWLRSGRTGTSEVAPQVYDEPSVVGSQSPARPLDLVQMGERVAAEHGCLRCHTTDGTPHIGPTWAALYQSEIPLADGKVVRADEAYLTESMMDPAAKQRRGFALVMPSYQGLLRPEDVGALVELIKSVRDVPPRAPETVGPRPAVIPLPAGPIGPIGPTGATR